MDVSVTPVKDMDPPYEVVAPEMHSAHLVVASPHSGTDYPEDFLAGSRLDALTIRRSEDSYVDRLFGAAPVLGAPLLRARFPRAYVDVNREAFELDPDMFEDDLPDYANTVSPRVAAGLGTVARVVCSGSEIYGRKLRFGEVLERINRCYRPYHEALRRLIEGSTARFGRCLLLDCHSMPSVGGPMDCDRGRKRVDFVLGDCYGASCAPEVMDAALDTLTDQGYMVVRNTPYAGGFTTQNYGRPRYGVHALQIEINRALYMDEASYTPKPYFDVLAGHMRELLDRLAAVDLAGPSALIEAAE